MKGKVKDGAEVSSLGYQENGDPINSMWGIQRSWGGCGEVDIIQAVLVVKLSLQ